MGSTLILLLIFESLHSPFQKKVTSKPLRFLALFCPTFRAVPYKFFVFILFGVHVFGLDHPDQTLAAKIMSAVGHADRCGIKIETKCAL